MSDFLHQRNALQFNEVSFGHLTLEIFDDKEIEDAQIGYSIDPDGNDLTGDSEGDWHSNWLVIGIEYECGDPIFVDTSEKGFPVYTAMHGQGEWDPDLIASSYEGFIQALSLIKSYSEGRTNPVELEKNPLSELEKKYLLDQIVQITEVDSLIFWEIWLEV